MTPNMNRRKLYAVLISLAIVGAVCGWVLWGVVTQ